MPLSSGLVSLVRANKSTVLYRDTLKTSSHLWTSFTGAMATPLLLLVFIIQSSLALPKIRPGSNGVNVGVNVVLGSGEDIKSAAANTSHGKWWWDKKYCCFLRLMKRAGQFQNSILWRPKQSCSLKFIHLSHIKEIVVDSTILFFCFSVCLGKWLWIHTVSDIMVSRNQFSTGKPLALM